MVDNCKKTPLLIVKVSNINNYRLFWGTVITQMGHFLGDKKDLPGFENLAGLKNLPRPAYAGFPFFCQPIDTLT
jgi:hypothetical protein